jgi:hypothetical protein
MPKTKKKRVTPMNATSNELCDLPRDHKDSGNWSLMTNSYVVWLSEQKTGEERKQHFEIPRAVFNRLLRWYMGEV